MIKSSASYFLINNRPIEDVFHYCYHDDFVTTNAFGESDFIGVFYHDGIRSYHKSPLELESELLSTIYPCPLIIYQLHTGWREDIKLWWMSTLTSAIFMACFVRSTSRKYHLHCLKNNKKISGVSSVISAVLEFPFSLINKIKIIKLTLMTLMVKSKSESYDYTKCYWYMSACPMMVSCRWYLHNGIDCEWYS